MASGRELWRHYGLTQGPTYGTPNYREIFPTDYVVPAPQTTKVARPTVNYAGE